MGVDEITEMENVEKYLERFQLSISRGEIDKCIAVAREGVGEYPNNYILLDKLMYALLSRVMMTVTFRNGKKIWKGMILKSLPWVKEL